MFFGWSYGEVLRTQHLFIVYRSASRFSTKIHGNIERTILLLAESSTIQLPQPGFVNRVSASKILGIDRNSVKINIVWQKALQSKLPQPGFVDRVSHVIFSPSIDVEIDEHAYRGNISASCALELGANELINCYF
jgi:hypothetical protein